MSTTSKPGPKPMEYIPEQFHSIEGWRNLTTVGQLERLQEYLETPRERRLPCIRLGATVPPSINGKRRPSTATYAVTVRGVVSVFRLTRDPRAAHRWVMNPQRPWNVSARFSGYVGARQ